MLQKLSRWLGRRKRPMVALLPLAVSAVFALTLNPGAAQIPNASTDQLLQQYRQGQSQGAASGQAVVPQDVVIQPVMREDQAQLPPSRA